MDAGEPRTPIGIDAELASIGAVLVDERVLRRVIKRDRRVPGIGLQVPHAHTYWVSRDVLGALVGPRELAVAIDDLPEHVIVIRGDRAQLGADGPAHTFAWRAIFHARVHRAFDQLVVAGKLTASAIRERINRIGQTEFDEIRLVLRQENLLLPPADDPTMYAEFVALYLELKHFAPRSLERTFPALHDTRHVDAAIARDLDHAALLAASRPPRATEPTAAPEAVRAVIKDATPDPDAVGDPSVIPAAARARRRGNRARAAMLAFRAGEPVTARADLDALVTRLAAALATTEIAGWVDILAAVARYAAGQGGLRFLPGARLLHDLQSACVVAEREDQVVDVVTWALSRGKRPIVRALPAAREVRIAKHVHAAAKKIAEAGLATGSEREQLARVVHQMVERADANVRTMLRPKIEGALDAVDLKPRNLPERVAQRKVVDELLDQAVAVGRLSLGNLRDALSHNDLKMPDLRAAELIGSDQLLRCDHLLSLELDGVYRRGEIYLRFFQKLSSVLFGTRVGRILSMYFLLPFIGAYVILEGTQHVIVGLLLKHTLHIDPDIVTTESKIGLTAFLFLMIHAPPVRRAVVWALRAVGRTIWVSIRTCWRVLFQTSVMKRVLGSRVGRWVLRPLIPAALAWLVFPSPACWVIGAVTFLIVAIETNTRVGQVGEEMVTDWTVRSGRQIGHRIVPGVVRWLLEVFARAVELVDRAIYRVDEWLRFRTGQSSTTLVIKGALGTVWFFIAYFLRLYVNLFVEPVINPVKHFPTVTVAAKLMLPFTRAMTDAIRDPLASVLGPALGGPFAWFTVFVIPGLAGFLVWELKENYKLYRKTRSANLGAVAIGHHGETMVRFLKPGFHSGTIPKLYSGLRTATWHGDDHAVARHKEGLHHVEEAIVKFVDRELVALLDEAAPFTPTDVAVEHVDLGSNRIQITLACPSVSRDPVIIVLEQQSGWLIANCPQRGWVDVLDDQQRQIFQIALAGFYKLSGVDLVREQIESLLRDRANIVPAYDIADEGLIVWPGDGYETEAIYRLRVGSLSPVMRGTPIDTRPPSLTGMHAVFRNEPLPWAVWTRTWENLAAGTEPLKLLGPSLLWERAPASAAMRAAVVAS